MRLTLLSILFLFIFSVQGFAQYTFSGTVKGSKGQSLEFATVTILKEDKSTILASSATDKKGLFNISIDDYVHSKSAKFICATYLNYRSDTLSIGSDSLNIQIILRGTVISLSEVTVNSEVPSITRKADRFVFIPSKELTKGVSALDILRITPLIQYDNKNDLFSIINKEGTIIYINNRKSIMPKDMIISQLRSSRGDNIKSIEIITNPGSEYPANSQGGVININLARMIDEGWSGNAMIVNEQGAYNTSIFNGTINYRKDKIAVRVSPFVNNSFNYNTFESLVEPQKDNFEYNTRSSHRRYLVVGGGIGLDYDIDKRNLLSINSFASTVNGKSSVKSNTKYDTQPSFMNPYAVFSSPINGNDDYLYNFGNIYFLHKFDSLSRKQISVNIDYNQLNQQNTDIGMFEMISPGMQLNKYRNILPQDFFNISEGVDYSSQINNKTKINIGGQMSNTKLTDDLTYYNFDNQANDYKLNTSLSNYYKYTENYFALYLGYTKSFSTKFNAVFGLRGEYIDYSTQNKTLNAKVDSNYISLFPNFSLSYAVTKKSNISISFSKKIKRPAIELLFPGRTYYNPNYFNENNPFLQPVLTYNLDFMYALRSKYYFSTGYNVSDNQYSRFIIPDVEKGEVRQKRTYLNYGDSRNLYFSFFTMQKLFKGVIDVNLSSTINFASYRVSENNQVLTTRGSSNVNYNFSISNTYYISRKKAWLVFTTIKYYSPIEDISQSRENILFSTDLGLRKTISNFSASLFVTDLFNTNGKTKTIHRSNAAYLYNEINQNNYTRSVSINLRYSFGNNKLNGIKNKNSANEELKRRLN